MTRNECRNCPYLNNRHKCSYNRKYIGFNVEIETISMCPIGNEKRKVLIKLNKKNE